MLPRHILLLGALILLPACAKEQQPVLVVTPGDIIEASKNPPGESNKRWKGRTLQITGTVKDSGSISLTLLDQGVFVVCYLKPVDSGPRPKYSPGQRLTIRGRCASVELLAVDLRDCEVIP